MRSAVVFDVDGVLVDSEPVWQEVRRELAASFGRPWPAEATAAMQGVSTAVWSAYLADTVGIPLPPQDIADRVVGAMADRYRKHLPLIPGAAEAVRRMASAWPLGAASGSPRRLLDAVIESPQLGGVVAASVSTDEVAAGKPAPDVYLAVIERLGADPLRCLAVEDSGAGMRAASAAGMRLVAVPQPAFPQAPDSLALADVVLDSLDALTIDLVATWLGEPGT